MGAAVYPPASDLRITAAGGGSTSSRSRVWKVALQPLAAELGGQIAVGDLPPGTSTWNKMAQRMVSHSRLNWRGRPLTRHAGSVNLIATTTTQQGVKLQAQRDTNRYPTGGAVTDQALAPSNLKKADLHGEWHYTISPRTAAN